MERSIMVGRLANKVALVTGGSRGIGRAICEVFAREGASVLVNYTDNTAKAEGVAAAITRMGGQAVALRADVASKSSVDAMVAAAIERFGTVDILVNNAGILRWGTALDMHEEDFDRMIAVNVKGMLHCAQAVAPGMIELGYGKIINLTSIAGLGTAVVKSTPYAMTKAAVIALTKRLAFELGPDGINVNAIAPGFVRTEMLNLSDDDDDPARIAALNSKAILNRIGTAEDIANAALFLASDESAFMTAQVLTVDGGRTDFMTHSG
jgi:3-oxoacyl-[acyl-carrier protein] reductase